MNRLVVLAIIEKILDEKIDQLKSDLVGMRGPRGFQGPPGNNFSFDEHETTIRNWVNSLVPKFSDFTPEQIEAIKGKDGKDFYFEENSGKIDEILRKKVAEISDRLKLKYDDLTDEEKEQVKGRPGRDGAPGRGFDFQEHEDSIKAIVTQFVGSISDSLRLKFEDLTEDQIEALRGRPGRDGKPGPEGPAGKGFDFAENEEFFKSLKLKFDDLTDEDKEQLKGRPGRDGNPGKGFSYEEHEDSIRQLLTSALETGREGFCLKFTDLSDDEKTELKLKFDDLTTAEKMELRGPRGQRGRQGVQGEIGDKGDPGLPGELGQAGPIGPIGMRGLPGVSGPRGFPGTAGGQGPKGDNAPTISNIEIEEFHNEIRFKFFMSDGLVFSTEWVEMPRSKTSGIAPVLAGNNNPATIFERQTISLVADVWTTITPVKMSYISDCEIYDDTAAERVELDVRFQSGRMKVDLKSKASKDFVVFLEGANNNG